MKRSGPSSLLAVMLFSAAAYAVQNPPADTTADCYLPVEGGWSIHLSPDPAAPRMEPGSCIGVVDRASSYGEGHAFYRPGQGDNPRLHRRPLYPPADKSLIWTEEECGKFPQCGFRPLVLAYNEPRFLFDFHSAGGLLGHLQIGLTLENGTSKWFHQWADLKIRYVEGRMEYMLIDPDFPGVQVRLTAGALAASVGLVVKVDVTGAGPDATLVWAYGGASAFFTNYDMTNPKFTFSPDQCAKDALSRENGRFTLTRAFDNSDSIMEQAFAAPRFISDWKATICAAGSLEGESGFGDPLKFTGLPSDLVNTMDRESATGTNCVAVRQARLPGSAGPAYIVVGTGGNIDEVIKAPEAAFEAMLARNRGIASRVVVRTPDPYLNAAATMMAFAIDGTWGDSTVMHGGWSWRFGYLGWRGWYGPTCYGWTGRIRTSIKNQVAMGLIASGEDAGALSSLLDTPGGVFYNMNEVFLDHVRHYFEYTNDLDLMREIFPALAGIVEWENRRLQPGNAYLYENALNTWISDSHWYIQGQCTQASAYMLGANRFLANLASRLGEAPGPYRERAERIRAAMQEKLWMEEEGVFAEYLDTRGEQLLHRQPELPTIYHAAEFGAADNIQIGRMLDWAAGNLKHEKTPGGGTLVWSSNWYPNNGRSYTHSTHELAYGEELNLALTQFLAGRSDDGYSLIRSSLCGVFNGPTPGGLSCHSLVDGRQRANDEFADAESMWGRAVVEGLFGINPKRPDGIIELTPQIVADWPEASIETPRFSYGWKRSAESPVRLTIDWRAKTPASVLLRLPAAWGIQEVRLDGNAVTPEPDASRAWSLVRTPEAVEGIFEVSCQEVGPAVPPRQVKREAQPAPESWQPLSPETHALEQWTTVDLAAVYNSTILDALEKVYKEAVPPPDGASRVGFDYWRSHLSPLHHGERVQMPSDAAWRGKVGADGVAWTRDGIPFKTVKEGPNIGVVTRAGGFAGELSFPVKAAGKTLYLMLSGMSFPVQSHMPHLRVTLQYAGSEQVLDLTSPETLGDCWSTWCNRWHDTAANGFENIGGRSGPAGSAEVTDRTQPVSVDTEAHLVSIPMRAGEMLEGVSIRAVANDIIFGIMGASVLK